MTDHHLLILAGNEDIISRYGTYNDGYQWNITLSPRLIVTNYIIKQINTSRYISIWAIKGYIPGTYFVSLILSPILYPNKMDISNTTSDIIRIEIMPRPVEIAFNLLEEKIAEDRRNMENRWIH